LQPFNQGNPSIWGIDPAHGGPLVHPLPTALQRLGLLDNIDKHRVVHTAWASMAAPSPETVERLFPPEFKVKAATSGGEPLVDGAEVGRVQFETPLPFDWEPDQMEMQGQFPVSVAFDEPPASVLNTLWFCVWGVMEVLTLFEPVFTTGQPPLPVTEVPVLPFPPKPFRT
jgi:hypothetical protein